jgi:hypothetical protein
MELLPTSTSWGSSGKPWDAILAPGAMLGRLRRRGPFTAGASTAALAMPMRGRDVSLGSNRPF